MLLDNIRELSTLSNDGKPFIYKNAQSVSLLFDNTAVQSEMYLTAPDTLWLGYTVTMMGFLLFNHCPGTIAMTGVYRRRSKCRGFLAPGQYTSHMSGIADLRNADWLIND